MLGQISVSVIIGAALFLGTIRLPAAPCVLTNAPSEKACTMGCCAYKSCCETSQHRTGLPTKPLAKSSSNQQNIAAAPAIVIAAIFRNLTTDSFVFSSAVCHAHSPPPLALICIRLI
jgi:hypothetical protein